MSNCSGILKTPQDPYSYERPPFQFGCEGSSGVAGMSMGWWEG